MRTSILVLMVAFLAAACSSEPVKPQAKAAVETPRPTVVPAPKPESKPEPKVAAKPVETQRIVADPLNDPNSVLAKRSIYYDFDKSEIKQQFQPLVQAHAAYLAGHRSAKVTIEGNCDERGSREYNLALGQRRADSVKEALKLSGAGDAQIETTSWGEEKPKASGHDETSWAENRRSDVVYMQAK